MLSPEPDLPPWQGGENQSTTATTWIPPPPRPQAPSCPHPRQASQLPNPRKGYRQLTSTCRRRTTRHVETEAFKKEVVKSPHTGQPASLQI